MPKSMDGTKLYLDYLDKEMTIMGILSTFCVAAAALVIDRVASAQHNSFFGTLATAHMIQVFIGAGLLLWAGLCFYLQRSTLAYCYGCLCRSIEEEKAEGWTAAQWLNETSSWAMWLRYRSGFMLLSLTGIVFVPCHLPNDLSE